jgi:hypothetical protein
MHRPAKYGPLQNANPIPPTQQLKANIKFENFSPIEL